MGSAARLPHFIAKWEQVTANNFILNIIKYGYIIQFEYIPYQEKFYQRNYSPKDIIICKTKITKMLACGAIITVQPDHDQFLSSIFPVPKRALNEYRIILDLSELNDFVRKISFKMDSLDFIITMIRPGDFFVSIDISDAYYAVAMNIISMPYLTFMFLNVLYQFTCLPQGLTSAPRIFTKILRYVLIYLRSQSIRISAWLDDLMIASSSASLTSSQTTTTLGTLEELGFLPNYAKSVLTPTQRILHLGLIWDSVAFTISVQTDKLQEVQAKCRIALKSKVPIRHLSSILGSIEYFRWGFPFAAIHYRLLQRFVNKCLAKGLDYNSVVFASESAKIDLNWWKNSGTSLIPRSLSPFSASLTVYSDASMQGWGGWTSDNRESFGSWSLFERSLHINILELQAVIFLFRCFFISAYDCSIAIKTDNSTVVAYINHQGGSACNILCDKALELWKFCIDRNIDIKAYHLGGIFNDRADYLSRYIPRDHSYYLNQEVFDYIVELLFFDLIYDCFASRLNTKLKTFFAWHSDPYASAIDAFSNSWEDNVYLFPPITMIHTVISKFIAEEVGHGLLICPFWPSQPWFPSLLEILIDSPLILPSGSIMDEDNMLPSHSRLLAWPIGSRQQEKRAYRDRLQKVVCVASNKTLLLNTNVIGGNSIIGFIENRIVTVKLL